MTSTSSGRSAPPAGARRRHGRATSKTQRRTRAPRELREAGLTPRKSLGQHFLTDARVLRRIADACELDGATDVIEIGPGLGGLTAELSARARRVTAIEIDGALAGYLARRFVDTNVRAVHADALEAEPRALIGRGRRYVVAGNLPYRVAQPLLRRYLESRPRPERLVVMVQAEVASSIVARPGAMSLLAVSVQLYGTPKLLFRVAPSAFYPPPKVRSAVVRIDIAPAPRADVDDTEAFFRVARAGFSTKRKQIRNALANGLQIDGAAAGALLVRARIDPTLRAQALDLDQWAALARAWTAAGRPGTAS